MTRRTAAAARRCAAASALVTIGLSGAPAQAQLLDQFLSPSIYGRGVEPGVTVTSRDRSDYDTGGIRAGSFIIRPQITESAGYETNVLGTSSPRGSALIQSNAVLDATSNWSRNSVRASVRVDDFRYLDLPRQSFTNWSATLGGTYEIGRDVISASYSHLNLTQTSRDLDVPQLNQALTYRIDAARLEYRAPFNRVTLTPAFEIANYDYGNGALLSSTTLGSTPLGSTALGSPSLSNIPLGSTALGNTVPGSTYQQNYRNRVVFTPGLTVGYEFSPRRNALLVVRNSIAAYSSRAPGSPKRDYNDTAVLAGLDYDINGVVRFRVLGGYEVRVFDAAEYKTIQAPIAEGSVAWTPTGLTTVTGTIARRIQDSADETTIGFTETSLRLRVDHEYLRNVLLQANAGLYYGQYNRGTTDQTLYTAGAGADYLLNRNLRVGATYDFIGRTSGGGGTLGTTNQQFGSGFSDHRVLLNVRFGL